MKHLEEGKEVKGGTNPPNTSDKRPAPPGGSGKKARKMQPLMKWYRVGKVHCQSTGIEVEVDVNATEDERERIIYEAVAANLDTELLEELVGYDYQEIDGPNGKPLAS